MGLFDRFKKKKEESGINEEILNKELPDSYLNFLTENLNGTEIEFEERYWNIMGESELLESWEMNGVGTAKNFECLKLYVQVQREYGQGEYTTSNIGNVELKRVEHGFVIGDENGDYLYFDPSDNYSVWIYYHDGGDVLRISDSFEKLMLN